jgi:hypothetical protein
MCSRGSCFARIVRDNSMWLFARNCLQVPGVEVEGLSLNVNPLSRDSQPHHFSQSSLSTSQASFPLKLPMLGLETRYTQA